MTNLNHLEGNTVGRVTISVLSDPPMSGHGHAQDKHKARLPESVRSIEGSRAKEAWETVCCTETELNVRLVYGFWQMGRALWRAKQEDVGFPDHVSSALRSVSDNLQYGYPKDWSFAGALEHLVKVGDRLAETLETADIEKDAGLPRARAFTGSDPVADARQYEKLLLNTRQGRMGGLIAFADALFINIDASEMRRFAKAYSDYTARIARKIEQLKEAALEQAAKDAAAAETRLQAAYKPFDATVPRWPTASQLQGSGGRLLENTGWTNGHLVDIYQRPKAAQAVLAKNNLGTIAKSKMDIVLDDAKRTARIPVTPLADFAPEFDKIGRPLSRADAGIRASVVLANLSEKHAIKVGRHLYNYFVRVYPGCTFKAPADGKGALQVMQAEKVVGLLMAKYPEVGMLARAVAATVQETPADVEKQVA